MIPVGRLAPANCWDQTLIEDIIRTLPVDEHAGYPAKVDGCIISVPDRFWAEHYDQINEALARYKWVLLLRVSDEEDWFDCRRIEHPNIKFWVQTPRFPTDRYPDGTRFLPVGFTPHTRQVDGSEKLLDVFLSAQRTHVRRVECFASLTNLPNSRIEPTQGFTQGMSPGEYAKCMGLAKIVPCPSGAVSVDSFRVWEALQAGALPVVDTVSPVDGVSDYWVRVLGDVPFPVVTDWNAVNWAELLEQWPENVEHVQQWWSDQKKRWAQWLMDDLKELGAR